MTDRSWKFVEMGVDKGVLAIVLAGFGFWMNRSLETYKAEQTRGIEEYKAEQANSLEVHKSKLEEERRDREKRTDAIESILATNNDMLYVLSAAARKDYKTTDQDVDRYVKSISSIQAAHTRYQRLFSDFFTQELDRYLRVHTGFSKRQLKDAGEYFTFFQDLSRRLSRVCDFEVKKTAQLPEGDFVCLAWDTQQMNEAGSPKYFHENHEAWLRWRQGGKK